MEKQGTTMGKKEHLLYMLASCSHRQRVRGWRQPKSHKTWDLINRVKKSQWGTEGELECDCKWRSWFQSKAAFLTKSELVRVFYTVPPPSRRSADGGSYWHSQASCQQDSVLIFCSWDKPFSLWSCTSSIWTPQSRTLWWNPTRKQHIWSMQTCQNSCKQKENLRKVRWFLIVCHPLIIPDKNTHTISVCQNNPVAVATVLKMTVVGFEDSKSLRCGLPLPPESRIVMATTSYYKRILLWQARHWEQCDKLEMVST